MDPIQVALMNEECILVDRLDNQIGCASKKECHLMTNIKQGMLHRAFSVFLLNNEGKLLLQRRSKHKITFPLCWTNTCCSHPLNIEQELAEGSGVKRAAIRKLNHELGISEDALKESDFKFITKILYEAASDGVWGEHEVDHILLLKGNFPLHINENEVESVKYLSMDELKTFVKEEDSSLTPWFRLIAKKLLFEWWSNDFEYTDSLIHHLE